MDPNETLGSTLDKESAHISKCEKKSDDNSSDSSSCDIGQVELPTMCEQSQATAQLVANNQGGYGDTSNCSQKLQDYDMRDQNLCVHEYLEKPSKEKEPFLKVSSNLKAIKNSSSSSDDDLYIPDTAPKVKTVKNIHTGCSSSESETDMLAFKLMSSWYNVPQSKRKYPYKKTRNRNFGNGRYNLKQQQQKYVQGDWFGADNFHTRKENHLVRNSKYDESRNDNDNNLYRIDGKGAYTESLGFEQWGNNQPSAISTTQILDFMIYHHRLLSYKDNWPYDSPITPAELAKAGFLYIGPSDRVQCAWCKGVIYKWEQGDTGIGKHKRYFPDCPFIKKTTEESLSMEKRTAQAIKIALEMGYSPEIVQRAVTDILANENIDQLYPIKLLEKIFEYGNDKVESKINPEKQVTNINEEPINLVEGAVGYAYGVPTEENISSPTLTDNNCTNSSAVNITDDLLGPRSDNISHNDNTDENLHVRETLTCKVCLEKGVSILFLPCRHLVCCEECGNMVSSCPMCRTRIAATVKTLLLS